VDRRRVDAVAPLVVGFDLDMTLIDSRPGIGAVYDLLAAETGVHIDSALATSRLGPPLDVELAHWFPAERIPALSDRFRALYPGHAIAASPMLPGAAEAIAAARRHGAGVVVVTGKFTANARLHLAHAGLAVDAVEGWSPDQQGMYGAGKAAALRRHGVTVYVGDHVADVAAAHAAGALAVGVPTGPYGAAALTEAGADVVLTDLTAFGAWLDEHVLAHRLGLLAERLTEVGGLLVAFSGGADSAFLLAAAVDVLGAERVVAATAVSPSLPAAELTAAREFAAGLGVRHLTPRTDELSRPGYRANAGDRCFHCKAELLDVVTPLAAEFGLPAVATGTNADDAGAGFRPGIRAAAERGAITPLLDAGLTKAQIRAASRARGLSTWDQPAAACLSRRVAYGVQISAARLGRVELAEAALRTALAAAGLTTRDLRVRDLGADRARVEVDAALVPVLRERADLLAAVEGFSARTVEEFRSGAMNELLPDADRYR
jgi:pyridinium-3,5-biscarboxylic acid mononucleotide sulfurtransferase